MDSTFIGVHQDSLDCMIRRIFLSCISVSLRKKSLYRSFHVAQGQKAELEHFKINLAKLRMSDASALHSRNSKYRVWMSILTLTSSLSDVYEHHYITISSVHRVTEIQLESNILPCHGTNLVQCTHPPEQKARSDPRRRQPCVPCAS
jgi:hypothetical protein